MANGVLSAFAATALLSVLTPGPGRPLCPCGIAQVISRVSRGTSAESSFADRLSVVPYFGVCCDVRMFGEQFVCNVSV